MFSAGVKNLQRDNINNDNNNGSMDRLQNGLWYGPANLDNSTSENAQNI